MLSNLHTHTTFCDGKNTAEEMVVSAVAGGFDSLGFSGHAPTFYDSSYCMKDVDAYIAEINRVKEKYKDKITVYLGIEEDCFELVDRSKFEYIIGSCHYIKVGDEYCPVDSGKDRFDRCMELCNNDPLEFAERYYSAFCDYIKKRKPDIIGHFDLLTKREEKDTDLFFSNEKYHLTAEKYLLEAMKSGCIFEVNTGAISRGMRKTPYPHERLLHLMKKNGAKITLSSDTHAADTIDFVFDETKAMLRDVGYNEIYCLDGGEFKPFAI